MDTHPGTQDRHGPFGPLRANLRFGLADGIGYSLMVGFGETYLAAFALALGFGEIFTGLLATLPLFAGALLQLSSPFAIARLRSRRRWVMLCATLQVVAFLPLVLAASRGSAARGMLLLVAALYWGANFGTGPAWTSWMESVVPRRIRTHYFARRTGFTQLAVIVAILGGGSALQLGESRGAVLAGFAFTFAMAAVSRSFSLTMLWRQTEPEKPGARLPELRLGDALRQIRARAQGTFLLYLLLIQMAVSISGPFFAPFMLRRLAMPYSEYMSLLATAFLAKVAILLLTGRLTRLLGARRLLLIGGIGIAPIASLWLFSSAFLYLMGLQVFGGIVWAFYELGVFLLIFERIRVEERTAILTLYNLAHASCSVLGSLIGAALFALSGAGHAYIVIFLVSSVARMLAIPLLLRLGPVPSLPWMVLLRTIAVRPASGGIGWPLFAPRGRRRRTPGDR